MFLFILSLSSNQINAGETQEDCCSDCCRWSDLFGDCMTTRTLSYCLLMKPDTYCVPCVVVTPGDD